MDINASRGYISWIINDGRFSPGINTRLASGTLPVLKQDHRYVIYVFYNVTGESLPIEDLSVPPLEPGQCALYILDPASGNWIDGGRYAHTGNIHADTFVFRAFSSDTGQFFIDNLKIGNQLKVEIPEPRNIPLLFGTFSCIYIALKRRRNRM